jgi:phenylacetic acid degradation operon negative regulatory protein
MQYWMLRYKNVFVNQKSVTYENRRERGCRAAAEGGNGDAMKAGRNLKSWIRRRLRAEPPRSKSLIVTVLGDSIAPRARGLWLSEMIELLRPFDVDERLVRTSAFRLAEEGWIEPQRHGRRSRYLLTDSGAQRIESAYRRIYDSPPQSWDGRWTMVIANGGNGAGDRAQLRKELAWEGFALLAPGVALHPCADSEALAAMLQRLGLRAEAMVLEAREQAELGALSSRRLLAECWRLDELAAQYQRFVRSFEPLLSLLENGGDEADAELVFAAQTLLIHAYRRVVLHDPRLPGDLLPAQWPGRRAYELCRSIYLRSFETVTLFLDRHLEKDEQRSSTVTFYQRFGGLKPGAFKA